MSDDPGQNASSLLTGHGCADPGRPPARDDPIPKDRITDIQTEEVTGELVLWRVFGVADVFKDRPKPSWGIEEHRGPGPDDKIRLSLGDVPAELISAFNQWRAQFNSILNAHFAVAQTYADVDTSYARELSDETPIEFSNPYPLWFAMRLSRPTTQDGVVTGIAPLWFQYGYKSVAEEVAKFEAKGNEYLDGALASMIGALAPLNLGLMRVPGRTAWFIVSGRPAWRVPSFQLTISDSGTLVTRSKPWAEAVPLAQIQAALTGLPAASKSTNNTAKLVGRATALFSAARAVEENDDLGRFVYAFAGLELLATQVAAGRQQALLDKLEATSPELPFRELFWPSKGQDWAERNLIFRVSLMASLYSLATAKADIEVVKGIAKTRNALFHGSNSASDLRTDGVACTELLRRYIGLIAQK